MSKLFAGTASAASASAPATASTDIVESRQAEIASIQPAGAIGENDVFNVAPDPRDHVHTRCPQDRLLRIGHGATYDCFDPGSGEPLPALKSGNPVHIPDLPCLDLSLVDFDDEDLRGRIKDRRHTIIPYGYSKFHFFTDRYPSIDDAETRFRP